MPAPPEWLKEMANSVAAELEPIDSMAPLGCHYHNDGDHWEVTLFVARTEIVGGSKDGIQTASRFTMDLHRLHGLFDVVSEFYWQAQPLSDKDELGPHISLEGTFQGHTVCVRVVANAPRRYGPGRIANVYDASWVELW